MSRLVPTPGPAFAIPSQKTGELYGQRFKAASIRGESKSYGDHLDDLIREKGAHLKISA
jgi:hypothetical protein